jgi:gamma-glutamyl-gamma-aminobutyrate hydrolase PuuD
MKRGARQGRPLIGVTTSEVREAERIQQTPESEPRVREMVLGLTYLRALEAAGALPIVIPPLPEEAIGSLLDRLDGICLSGGPDLDPGTYGAGRHPELGPTELALDRFELEMARRADTREMPILAICRGTQALNVARRGSLIQHLPEVSPELSTGSRRPATRPATRSRSSRGADWRRRWKTRKSRCPTCSTSTPSTTRRSNGWVRG